MATPLIKYSTYCSNSILAIFLLNLNFSKGKKRKLSCEFPNCWGSSKIDLWKLWKLENIPKVYKRKGIQNCSPNFEFKYFQNFTNSKTEVVGYISLLLQASTYNILSSLGWRKQMPPFGNYLKIPKIPETEKLKQVTSGNILQLSLQWLININKGHTKGGTKDWFV